MEKQSIPAFGESDFFENQANSTTHVWSIRSACHFLEQYRALYLENGYIEKECYARGGHQYLALQKGEDGVFLNAYAGTDELYIVEEKSCTYFSYTDKAGEPLFVPQITQVTLKDFGMSYVVRVSDGRLIVIDGGFPYEEDVEQLYRTMCESSPHARPVIAAWILTHTHEDHMQCFVGFMKRHAQDVFVEKMLFHFPKHDDFLHYPDLETPIANIPNSAAKDQIPLMHALIKENGIPIFTPHTGQKFCVGDAKLEFLACMDDTIHLTNNGNAISLVFRMELCGQVILWTADAGCSYARLDERYGKELKADILQVPHHGFQSGTAEAELRTYELVQPQVCLLPVDKRLAYTLFCIFRKGTRYLMDSPAVKEIITGSEQRTLELPYMPRARGRAEIAQSMRQGLACGGADTWIFSDLCTDCEEDMTFTLLNTTFLPVSVQTELYFTEGKVKKGPVVQLKGRSLKLLHLLDKDGTLPATGERLPENTLFAVRFSCDAPIVVSHKTHKAAYHSSY